MREYLEDHRMDTRRDTRNDGHWDESCYGQRKDGKASGTYGCRKKLHTEVLEESGALASIRAARVGAPP